MEGEEGLRFRRMLMGVCTVSACMKGTRCTAVDDKLGWMTRFGICAEPMYIWKYQIFSSVLCTQTNALELLDRV